MKVHLRLWREDDTPQLTELANNIHIWNNLRDRLPHPYLPEHAAAFIQYCNAENAPAVLAIEADGQLAGCIGIERQTDVSRVSAELGYWIGEPYWGKNIATMAVAEMTHYVFAYFPLIVRLYARVFEYNKASMRVLEKNGYHLESIQKKSAIKNNRILDEYIWVKLRDPNVDPELYKTTGFPWTIL